MTSNKLSLVGAGALATVALCSVTAPAFASELTVLPITGGQGLPAWVIVVGVIVLLAGAALAFIAIMRRGKAGGEADPVAIDDVDTPSDNAPGSHGGGAPTV